MGNASYERERVALLASIQLMEMTRDSIIVSLCAAQDSLKCLNQLIANTDKVQVIQVQKCEPYHVEQDYLLLCSKVDILELSTRIRNIFIGKNIMYIGDLVQMTEKQLLRGMSLGQTSVNEIKMVLASRGLWLGMKLENWSPTELKKF